MTSSKSATCTQKRSHCRPSKMVSWRPNSNFFSENCSKGLCVFNWRR